MNDTLTSLVIPPHVDYIAIDDRLQIVEVSARVDRFVEQQENLAIGNDIRDEFPELFGIEETIEAIARGESEPFEFKAISRFFQGSSPLYFDLYVSRHPQPGRAIVFLEDVSDRMQLEQNLVQASNETNLLVSSLTHSRNYINQILASMAEVLLVTTTSGKIKTANAAAQQLFGYREDELRDRSITLIIGDEQLLSPLNASGETVRADIPCRTKSGDWLSISFSRSEIDTDTEGVTNLVYIGRDITDRQRQQQRQSIQYAVTRILAESASFAEAASKILQAIGDTLEWDGGQLWTSDSPDAPTWRCVECWGNVTPSTASAGFVQAVRTTATAQWVDDLRTYPYATPDELWRGTFGFPIQTEGNVLGAIAFFSHRVQKRDRLLLQTLSSLGAQLGQFVQRKRAEAALRESEERYRDLFENASDLIQSVAPDGRFLYVNRAWKDALGYDDAELEHLNCFDLLHPESKGHCMAMWEQVMAGEAVKGVRAAFVSRSGKKISVEGNINCRFVDGQPVATRGIFRDITQRLEAEAALRQAEENFRSIFENATEGIYQTTPEGRYLSANPALAYIYGYASPAELIEQTDNITRQIYVDPDRRAEFVRLIEQEGKVLGFESQVYRRDGAILWVSENARVVRDAAGTLLYYEGTVEDITEHKLSQEALRYQQEQTERLLLNILPAPIAERLKAAEHTIADNFEEVTVLFADLVGFTPLAAQLSPTRVVDLLNQIFSQFDRLSEEHGLEKIKTIGDAYMVVGGLPTPREDHADAIAQMALAMQQAIATFNDRNQQNLNIRIGIHSGPVVAGIIGIKKFNYDLWGDTVNIASRMESQGLAGQIQVSEATYERLRDRYQFVRRGKLRVKGKGEMTTYLLVYPFGSDPNSLSHQSRNYRIQMRQKTREIIAKIDDKLREV